MIRFAALQFRAQALVAGAGLVVLAIVLVVTGPHLVHLYDTSVAGCRAGADCASARATFLRTDHALRLALTVLMAVVPGLIGLFWGAPLVARELETGTYRLAWTQVHHSRWLAAELGLVGLASIAVAGLMSLMVTWWASPIDSAKHAVYASFDQRDIVPMGFAAAAFALGVLIGVLVRRTLPAIFFTLVGFVALQLLFVNFVRPNLLPPSHTTIAITQASAVNGNWSYGTSTGLFGTSGPSTLIPPTPAIPDAWVYSTQLVDRSGIPLTAHALAQECPLLVAGRNGSGGGAGIGGGETRVHSTNGQVQEACVTKIGATYHELVTYQPANHYWPLQWAELGIYLALAVGLGVCGAWLIRRRIG